jgi:hypothetical protein
MNVDQPEDSLTPRLAGLKWNVEEELANSLPVGAVGVQPPDANGDRGSGDTGDEESGEDVEPPDGARELGVGRLRPEVLDSEQVVREV